MEMTRPIRSAGTAGLLDRWLEALRAESDIRSDVSEGLYSHTPLGDARFLNLRRYLTLMLKQRPAVILVGEAPGYRGSRRTGVPFVSEALASDLASTPYRLMGGSILLPLLDGPPVSEQTASVVWRELSNHAKLPLLWAAYPRHPHEVGNPSSNRTPSGKEVDQFGESLAELIRISGVSKVVALGNSASRILKYQGIDHVKIRHPAHGGAPKFARGMSEIGNARSP